MAVCHPTWVQTDWRLLKLLRLLNLMVTMAVVRFGNGMVQLRIPEVEIDRFCRGAVVVKPCCCGFLVQLVMKAKGKSRMFDGLGEPG
jgi:hypothetical protein